MDAQLFTVYINFNISGSLYKYIIVEITLSAAIVTLRKHKFYVTLSSAKRAEMRDIIT